MPFLQEVSKKLGKVTQDEEKTTVEEEEAGLTRKTIQSSFLASLALNHHRTRRVLQQYNLYNE
jgi:hypothetical protein